MDRFLNTKAKKIWFYWMVGLLLFETILLLSLTFVVSAKIVSNVFFGVGSITLALVVIAWFSSKRTSFGEMKEKDFTMTDDAVRSYFPDVKKITQADIINARKKRGLYQVSWSLIASSISFIIALIYAFG